MNTRIYLSFLIVLAACTQEPSPVILSSIILSAPASAITRAGDPDDSRITDYNLYIFNSFGTLEERVYVPARSLRLTDGKVRYTTTLLKDVPYTLLAAANLGYQLPFQTLEEALSYRYHLAYPDEFSQGIPMAAFLEEVTVGDDGCIEIPLERLMARVELSVDRSELLSDIQFRVMEVRVGACPSSVQLVGPSKVSSREDCFTRGYGKARGQVNDLNLTLSGGMSRSLSVYLLENRQGDLLDNVLTDSGKVFYDGRYNEVCSYIELKAEYHSSTLHTPVGQYLIYRFYLGENLNNFDVCRNCWYQVTVKPRGDGLAEDSWRVDKSGLIDS